MWQTADGKMDHEGVDITTLYQLSVSNVRMVRTIVTMTGWTHAKIVDKKHGRLQKK